MRIETKTLDYNLLTANSIWILKIKNKKTMIVLLVSLAIGIIRESSTSTGTTWKPIGDSGSNHNGSKPIIESESGSSLLDLI